MPNLTKRSEHFPGNPGKLVRALPFLLAFFIPALIVLVAYFAFRIEPFGDESVLVLDLNGQYVYYFENLRDAFWGDGSFVNSFSRNLSGEMIGTFAYYLASPFTLIVMLFPRAYITEALLIMQLLKVGCAGLSFYFYINRSHGLKGNKGVIFAVMYACMAYMIVQLMNPMWIDGLIYLPLICFAIELLIDRGKMFFLIIILSLMFTANFYIGWMVAIFCCVYFLVYYFFLSDVTPNESVSHFFLSGVRFGIGGILSAGVSAWLLLPLYSSLSLGKFSFTTPNFTPKAQFEILNFFKNMLPNAYDTCRPEGSPVVYCGAVALLLVPLFFMNDKVALRRKIGFGVLTLFLLLSMYISTIDVVWHGLQLPNWLPYRYSFMFSFVVILMAADCFKNLSGITPKNIAAVAFGLIVFVFWIDKQKFEDIHPLAAIWYTVALAVVYGFLLYYVKRPGKAKSIVKVLIAVTAVEFLISTTYNIYQIDGDVAYSKRSSYNRYVTLGRDTIDKLYEIDTSPFYRTEMNFHRTVNDAMAFGSYGITHSNSTMNSPVLDFLHKLGFGYGGHYIQYGGGTYVSDSILGIKYIIEKGTTPKAPVSAADLTENASENATAKPAETPEAVIALSKQYDTVVLANGDDTEIMYVYENPYALPLAYMVDEEILNVSITSSNPFDVQNELLSAMLSNRYQFFFRRITIDETIPENVVKSSYGSHIKYVPEDTNKNAQIEFMFTPPTDDMVYCYFPGVYERKVNLWLDDEFQNYYFEGGDKAIQQLGRFTPESQHSLIMTITDRDEVLYTDEEFYYLDEKLFTSAIETLKKGGIKIDKFTETHITGTITAEKSGVMLTTISNEPGWTLFIDGIETEIIPLCNDALIGAQVSAGTHTIELKFFPHYMDYGIIISIISLAALIMMGIFEFGGKKKEPETAVTQTQLEEFFVPETVSTPDLSEDLNNDNSDLPPPPQTDEPAETTPDEIDNTPVDEATETTADEASQTTADESVETPAVEANETQVDEADENLEKPENE
ncbi:MAG: YfhO family protein [Ruminococcus sp.]|jgi:uncharacterized membrane protein YfhO|nr:YfhO family protein [Ruminococcus sp.]